MPLKMRPTGLGAGIDKDRPDYTVFCGEWTIGRIKKRIMKMTREQLFAAPKLAGRAMARLERGIAAVSAARARAAEISSKPTSPDQLLFRSQGRRRVERLSALVTSNH